MSVWTRYRSDWSGIREAWYLLLADHVLIDIFRVKRAEDLGMPECYMVTIWVGSVAVRMETIRASFGLKEAQRLGLKLVSRWLVNVRGHLNDAGNEMGS